MDERDFEIGGVKFKLNKMDAFKQFHIVRRISPLLSELLPAMKEIARNKTDMQAMSDDDKFEQFAKIGQPLLMGFSKLSDEDANKVLLGLLSSVEIQQSHGNWARISTETAMMINNLELPVLMQAAGRAFMFNLSGFFAVAHRAS